MRYDVIFLRWIMHTIVEVSVSALCPKDEEPTDAHIGNYCEATQPPDHGIACKINLAMIFDPEVLSEMRLLGHSLQSDNTTHNSATKTWP